MEGAAEFAGTSVMVRESLLGHDIGWPIARMAAACFWCRTAAAAFTRSSVSTPSRWSAACFRCRSCRATMWPMSRCGGPVLRPQRSGPAARGAIGVCKGARAGAAFGGSCAELSTAKARRGPRLAGRAQAAPHVRATFDRRALSDGPAVGARPGARAAGRTGEDCETWRQGADGAIERAGSECGRRSGRTLQQSAGSPRRPRRVLFRQTAAEFVRLHPGLVTRPSWRERWRLAIGAGPWCTAAGDCRGCTGFPVATFEELEEPLGALDAAIYQPLNRLIETTAVSWSYALSNRSGWSVVESVRMLALLYPIGLWLLRWRAAGSKPQAEWMPEIITALDRGQGYAPLAGAKQRQRVRVLARLDELERLAAWYVR